MSEKKKSNGTPASSGALRKEVEAELATEATEAKKAAIKNCLRQIITLEEGKEAEAEKTKDAIAKIEKQIEDIESGKKAPPAIEYKNDSRYAALIPGANPYYGPVVTIANLWSYYKSAYGSGASVGGFANWARNYGYTV